MLSLAMLSACISKIQTEFQPRDVSPQQLRAAVAGKPVQLQQSIARKLEEGGRNEVLNCMRMGLAAFELGDLDLAAGEFDTATRLIRQVFSEDAASVQARSRYASEDVKDFKGEPYERAMAFYYRGLLFLREGDAQSAKAAFRAAIIQDAFAEEKQHRCDFALMIYMRGWAARCAGEPDLAAQMFAEARKLRPDMPLPAPDDDTLILAELGRSPRKVVDGVYGERLTLHRPRNTVETRVTWAGPAQPARQAYPLSDVAWQAMSRGGRAVDSINAGKVAYRQELTESAVALSNASRGAAFANAATGSSGFGAAGIALTSVGVLQMVLASDFRTRADDRYWDNLPETVSVATTRSRVGDVFQFAYETSEGGALPDLANSATARPAAGGTKLVWVRSRSAVTQLHGSKP
jgi:tetratricopeptide (TPR) repeat protein